MKNFSKLSPIFASAALLLSACGMSVEPVSTTFTVANSTNTTSSVTSASSVNFSSSSTEVKEQSSEAAVVYDPTGAEIVLSFEDSTLSIQNDNGCLEKSDTTLTITCAGVYYLEGSSENFQVIVNVADEEKVYLYLNNVSLKAPTAPLFVQNADKTFLVLIDGTENAFENGDSDTTAAIYAKDDLTFKGNGSLSVIANGHNGIHTSNDLKIKNVPTIQVTAENHAIKGKGSVEIEGGYFTLSAGADAVKSDEGEEDGYVEGKGYIQITGGEFHIESTGDAISAFNYVLIADSVSTPQIQITTTGNASSESTKGIKADSTVLLQAGIVEVISNDDAIHADGTIQIDGGTFTLTTADDGIHADKLLQINGGVIVVTNSYEGFEAKNIQMKGGTTYVYARDDGWNAQSLIQLSGGYHYVTTASGDTDGIDSNGDIDIDGGVLVIEAGNNIVDKGDQGTVNYTGGILMGFGKMNEGVPSSGTKLCASSISSGARISYAGESVYSTFTTNKSATTMIYIIPESSGNLYQGGSYSGTENAFGYGEGGTLSNGTALSTSTCSSSGMRR